MITNLILQLTTMRIIVKLIIYGILFVIILATMWWYLIGESILTSLSS